MTSEREKTRLAFLIGAGLAGARREVLPGDASTRRYERLHPAAGSSLILMDQPLAVESQPCPPDATAAERAALGYNAQARLAAGRVEAFVACAGWLRSQGLSAPRVIQSDAAAGLAVLEDLGDDLYARVLGRGGEAGPLYDGAIDALVVLHGAAPPDRLEANGAVWPLLTYDELALKTASDLFIAWLPRLLRDLRFAGEAEAEWEAIWRPIRARGAAGASVFCHRDYHAENLIWLPERRGAAQVGLLDFQDALRAHPAWDLSMLLHDARRDVPAELEARALARYFAARPEADRETFAADFRALGALNVVRILGLFARLVVRDAKPRYRAFMPRLWTYLDRCMEAPGPDGLESWLDRHLPPELRR